MKIIKPGIIVSSENKISMVNFRKYKLTCPACGCIFEANSSEFKTGDRDMPAKWCNCPTCNHYVFTANGHRIKNKI